jgi:hypothetical protein
MLNLLVGPIAQLAGTWLEGKVEKTKAVAKAQVAEAQSRATIAEKKATGDIDWEQAAIENTASSWKDEFALVVLMAPAVGVYVWPEEVQAGFTVLASLPEWYTWLLFIAVSSSFGIKGVGQAAKMLGKGK